MKTTIQILIFLFLTQIVIAQKNRIKLNQIFITNEITGRSVKIKASDKTLEKFGTLVSKDPVDPVTDIVFRYNFSNIYFDVSSEGKIQSFRTRSNEITLEVKGKFSFSPGDHIDKIATVFPYEVENAILWEQRDNKSYLFVDISLSGFRKHENKYFDYFHEKIVLKFNPESKILEEIHYWITP